MTKSSITYEDAVALLDECCCVAVNAGRELTYPVLCWPDDEDDEPFLEISHSDNEFCFYKKDNEIIGLFEGGMLLTDSDGYEHEVYLLNFKPIT